LLKTPGTADLKAESVDLFSISS